MIQVVSLFGTAYKAFLLPPQVQNNSQPLSITWVVTMWLQIYGNSIRKSTEKLTWGLSSSSCGPLPERIWYAERVWHARNLLTHHSWCTVSTSVARSTTWQITPPVGHPSPCWHFEWRLNGLTKDVALVASAEACAVEHSCLCLMHGGWSMCSRTVEHACLVPHAWW